MKQSYSFLKETIAILPLGSYEYHGPHLPFETDTLIANALVERIAKIKSSEFDLKILETERLGYSIEHSLHPQTKSLDYHSAIDRWIKIGSQLKHQGIQKLLILNAHGGNSPLVDIVIQELRVQNLMLAVGTHWLRFLKDFFEIPTEESHLDIHAGLIETSILLKIAPETVLHEKMSHFLNRQSSFIQDFCLLRAYGPHRFGWIMQDLNPFGATGNSLKANAGIGDRILKHASEKCFLLLKDMKNFECEALLYK